MITKALNDNSSIEQLTTINALFDNLCGLNHIDYDTNLIKEKLGSNCIAFILSNQPDLHSIINKYLSMGFKFHNILIYSKKHSMVSSYKQSKIFVYVFTKGDAKCVNKNIYGMQKIPVLTQKEIYKDLILQNIKSDETIIDFNALSDLKANICAENNINYVGIFTDAHLFRKLN